MKLALLEQLRQRNPLVFTIANFVTVNDVANGLIAIGAAPMMSLEPAEAQEMVTAADGITLNLGTLTQQQIGQMHSVGYYAQLANKPVVLDPVAVGAIAFRKKIAREILAAFPVNLIRGNAGEITALVDVAWQAKGVDAGHGEADLQKVAKQVAQRYDCVVVITGPTDIVTDGQRLTLIENGSALFPLMTGSGDLLSSICAAFLALTTETVDDFSAVTAACQIYATTGELAAQSLTAELPNSFRTALIDRLHTVTVAEIEKVARYQELK
ncbi:hydroxyethylthiazole kinase [Loigolactobacillus backii]|uniref:Hydroxyethylthiazole kinase n=1 Tax=Loigolactobacillus backii TaxID=375175 RepID=A0A192GZ82_9LACO|nr:hydroxyethylthiazole kinase [Loigolactobacillus backii]ANK60592.1 hydroxyethylthiazole kinase [Loigolactobacillus backii]ANK61839.1 hydroxyethylthiazole kinase [Loigolactobacillus backii]ANK65545.1 hydroxyethylthiazole kinase [Loigolactobacillus backii]ANK68016.1 hydroxyethylthiazole kinase [Loigolactobacillus backii]ANK68967.1 hydroxyethylthiazole kinase [Loigolactobacillus backii]